MRIALIGGFGAPPSLLIPLRRALVEMGHDATIAPLGLNIDCGEVTVVRLANWLAETNEPSALIGHSRGGVLGRVLAVRRPDMIERLVAVVTPWTVGPPDRPGVRVGSAVVRASRRVGLSFMASIDCADGPCCTAFRSDMTCKPDARWIALWSSLDRVARKDGRPPQAADVAVDIRTSHIGAVLTRAGIHAIIAALER